MSNYIAWINKRGEKEILSGQGTTFTLRERSYCSLLSRIGYYQNVFRKVNLLAGYKVQILQSGRRLRSYEECLDIRSLELKEELLQEK